MLLEYAQILDEANISKSAKTLTSKVIVKTTIKNPITLLFLQNFYMYC